MKHPIKKRLFLSAIAVAVTLFFCVAVTSCNTEKQNDTDNTVSFTDALGRELSIPRAPKRVAALIGSFADIWMLSGGELCAAAEDAWEDFGLDLPDAANIGGAHSPSLELLIASAPDLVLASASTASNIEMKDSLEAMGINVAFFEVDSFEDYLKMLDICTEITGRKDLYAQNGLDLKAQIDKIRSDYQTLDIPENERRVLLLRASSTSVKPKGSNGTVLGEMLLDIGCINIADSDNSILENLSMEAILRMDPYHIFVVTMGSNTDKALSTLEDMINENPAWSTLNAIKHGRLHVMDKTLFNLKPNAKFATAYKTLYETLTKQ